MSAVARTVGMTRGRQYTEGRQEQLAAPSKWGRLWTEPEPTRRLGGRPALPSPEESVSTRVHRTSDTFHHKERVTFYGGRGGIPIDPDMEHAPWVWTHPFRPRAPGSYVDAEAYLLTYLQRPRSVPSAVMEQLDAVREEAAEEGYPVPSHELVSDVRSLLRRLYEVAALSYTVYPMEEGEIAIDTGNERGSVVLLCHERETWCVANIGNSPSRAWFRDRERLPEGFIKGVLTTLARRATR